LAIATLADHPSNDKNKDFVSPIEIEKIKTKQSNSSCRVVVMNFDNLEFDKALSKQIVF
jgi:hypothetical protein